MVGRGWLYVFHWSGSFPNIAQKQKKTKKNNAVGSLRSLGLGFLKAVNSRSVVVAHIFVAMSSWTAAAVVLSGLTIDMHPVTPICTY
jgi:hypothetical protein